MSVLFELPPTQFVGVTEQYMQEDPDAIFVNNLRLYWF